MIVAVFISVSGSANTAVSAAELRSEAIFGGGCFWCMEPPFDELKGSGVIDTIVGYTGGEKANPSYKEVSAGTTGHIEVIKVIYDPKKISYEKLLEIFWRNIDPYDSSGQFCDKGSQYKSAVFYSNEAEKAAFEKSLSQLKAQKKLIKPVTVQLLPHKTFYPAEDDHQNYYEKNPVRYKYYRYSCGRDSRLKEVWGN